MKNGWVSHFRLSRAVFLCGLLLTVGGCGDTSTSSNTVDTDTYLFYSQNDSTGTNLYGLKAVDPAYPSTPINVFGAGTPVSPFKPISYRAGTINSSARTISDLHYRYVMYSDGNNLFRVSAEKDGGLSVAQVSNESEIVGSTTGPVPGICYTDSTSTFTWGYTDYANPLNSVFIYRKDPDGTTDCSGTTTNDSINIVQLKDDSSTAPGTYGTSLVQEPVAPIYNPDGSIAWIMVYTAQSPGRLAYVNVDFNNGYYIGTTGYSSRPTLLGMDSQGRILLAVYGPWGIDIQQFDPATLTLSATLHNSAAGTIPAFYASDGTYAYFHDAKTVYRVPFDGSASASVVADESGNFTGGLIRAQWNGFFSTNRIQDIHLSGNNIVYIYDDTADGGGVLVRSVPKSGGTPKTIYTFADNTELLAWRAAAGRVYLTDYTNKDAVSVGDTGSSPTVYNESWWLGFTYESSTRLFSDVPLERTGKVRDLTPKTIFRAQFDPVTGDLPARLISYDANTTLQLIDFGVPAPTFGSFGLGGPPDLLGLTTRERTLVAYDSASAGSTFGTDILYLNARNKSTMTVVARDSSVSAALVGLNNGGGCSFGNGRFDPLLPALILLSAVYIWRRRKSWRANQ